jgi:uncharacterized protein YkwD
MAKLLHGAGIPAVLGVLLAMAACDSSDPVAPESQESPSLPAEVGAFVAEMNAHRITAGCPALAWNEQVAEVAAAHSRDMVQRDYFSHTNPDGDSPFARLANAGIQYSAAAENIAAGYPTGVAVLAGWLGSPGHRSNIENCNLTEHGVGLEGTHWTHLFIRP